jgi:hypothetical protein
VSPRRSLVMPRGSNDLRPLIGSTCRQQPFRTGRSNVAGLCRFLVASVGLAGSKGAVVAAQIRQSEDIELQFRKES